MPEVITGISLLLLFIFMARYVGWPGERGFTTVTIAHITFAISYVAVIIQSRLLVDGSVAGGSRHGPGLKALAGAV